MRRHSPLAVRRERLKEVPTPEPGPNQVLIKIRASGMCYTDVHQTRGEVPSHFPRTLGHEPVGEIVAGADECQANRGISDVTGVTGMAIIQAILRGQRDPLELAAI
jgi:D-arabinose 1-dehydrogenase-like Zn-dependent alcohol dehydrogenase